MDPQHRLLLEVVWAALEDAGISPDTIRGAGRGSSSVSWAARSGAPAGTERGRATRAWTTPFFGYGLAPSVAAGRLSYVLDARGPSMCVDTACSSSLLAVHLAARSLRAGDCDLAAGRRVERAGHPAAMVQACRAHMLAPTGGARPSTSEGRRLPHR